MRGEPPAMVTTEKVMQVLREVNDPEIEKTRQLREPEDLRHSERATERDSRR